MRKLLLLLAIIALPFSGAHASEALKVGDTLPQNIALHDQSGAERDLADLVGDNGMLLIFYRSADWCPYCKAQLIDIRNHIEKFENEGFSIVGVSYDSVEKLHKFNTKHKPEFTLLSDPNSETIRKFGIFDDSHREGSFAYGVAKPHLYVVDNKGEIHAVLAEESYKNRPQVDAIMEAIRMTRANGN